MKELVIRSITGISIVVVFVITILLSPLAFSVLISLCALISLYEFYTIGKKSEIFPQMVLGIFSGILLLSASVLNVFFSFSGYIYLSIVPPVLMIYFFETFRNKNIAHLNISYTIFGIVYVIIPFVFFINIASFFDSDKLISEIFLGFFALVWINDTTAYLVGTRFGKNKISESISPKKTWEGFLGAILITSGFSLLLFHFYSIVLDRHDWIILAAIVCIFGTLGDFTESYLKRKLDIKDTGTILPGHGGMLDRFDGVLFSAPTTYIFLFIKYNIV